MAECPCESDVLYLAVLDAEGISPVSTNPLSPGGDSLNGGTGYWSPRTSYSVIFPSLYRKVIE